mgnify:CR=1 FL=1
MKSHLYQTKTDLGLFILRLTFGLGMMAHGLQKMNKFAELSTTFPDPIGVGSTASLVLAVFAELFCSLLLIVGLLTPLALVPLIITMVVALFVIHGADPWAKKELAFTYLAVYAGLLFSGPGKLSLDYRLFGTSSD